ncbi:hypothetical protein ACN2CC_15345 [Mesorhizobium muleiense]|uniref:hypothetical protein n=1 Tax=Mesorhizobium muleiense TaxID=1004279 RepID=UPI003AFB4954
MPDFDFSKDYGVGFFSGQRLHDRLILEGKDELILTITGIRLKTFSDAADPEWVLSFGEGEDELRLKKNNRQLGKSIADAFGNNGRTWVGKQIGLSADWITWTSRDEAKEGYTIKVRPIPLNSYALEAGKEQPRQDGKPNDDLEDEIPF